LSPLSEDMVSRLKGFVDIKNSLTTRVK